MKFNVETFDRDSTGAFKVEEVVAEQMDILGAGELFFSNGEPSNRSAVIVYSPHAWRTAWQEETQEEEQN